MFDINDFKKLPTEHQAFLQLLSIISLPIASTPLAQCANIAKIPAPDNQPEWISRSIKTNLLSLVHQKWLFIDSNRFSIPSELIDSIMLYSLEINTYHSLYGAIKEIFRPKISYSGKQVWNTWENAISDIRMTLFSGDQLTLKTQLADINAQFEYIRRGDCEPLQEILGEIADPIKLDILSDDVLVSTVLPYYSSSSLFTLKNCDGVWAEMRSRQNTLKDEGLKEVLNTLIAEQCLIRGDYEHFPKRPSNAFYSALWTHSDATRLLLTGKHESALKSYDQGIRLLRKSTKQRDTVYQGDIFEVFHFLQTLSMPSKDCIKTIEQAHDALSDTFIAYFLISAYAEMLNSGNDNDLVTEINLVKNSQDPYLCLIVLLLSNWAGIPSDPHWIDKANKFIQQANDNGYYWLAAEFSEALSRHLTKDSDEQKAMAQSAASQHEKIGSATLFNLVTPQDRWKRSLDALTLFADISKKTEEAKKPTNQRLVWLLSELENEWRLEAKVQKITKNGRWSKGRTLSAESLLLQLAELDFITNQDREICNTAIQKNDISFYSQVNHLEVQSAWPQLVGHPHVYWAQNRNTAIEISLGQLELLVTEEGDEIRVSLYPDIKQQGENVSDFVIRKETPTHLRVYELTEQHLQIINIVGNNLLLPKEAEAQLRETLMMLAPMMTIQSDIAGVDNAREITADSQCHVHLLPHGDGLRILLRVQPFGPNQGPIYPPALGRKNLLIEIEGEKVKLKRDFDSESGQVQQIQELIEVLADWENLDEELLLEQPEDALSALSGFHDLGDQISLEWPEGESLKIASTLGVQNMHIKVTEKGQWFELEGQAEINDKLVFSLQQLMAMSKDNASRFVKISDGQYVALTKNLQDKLNALQSYAEADGETTKISGIASLALDDFMGQVNLLEGGEVWQKHINKLKDIQTKIHTLPTTLKAELRDYQLEGFQWLSRLAEWRVGACLADDMGLGKTMQSLALILNRASIGPTLVIAPVSVCNNWYSEVEKFAPTLKPIFYRGSNRKAILEDLKPFDLIICSYGLLPQDSELLTNIEWSTALLDEAQAIKNIGTKRTKAAWNLKAGFKMITTGTPIENHLGELWSLFRFLNPGLLGTQDHFTRAYMAPIERFNDKTASQNLQRIIQPFILRRLKTEVLTELPPRTEIIHSVPLGKEERALYEAVRKKAMDKFSKQANGEKKANQIEVLAEITRLRLASCHPKLVMKSSPIESSKLKAFGEILDELLENDHKTLVFSQFVKHLTLIREYLDKEGISYQYLDGSTPQRKRKEAVDNFQAGQGDVFLISLKAGGSGLNLTEADYVIHMDPWWNPAVEDQASDRAHRIGQQRPVTIYRLVTENTIEEKIIKLHDRKRNLANKLLEGSDMSGKMSAQEMLQLMQNH
ncbi:MAG: DEAD/DEAH box helicase [Thiotrichaceae bacterium]|nr:DEAD/DEAH box helicase [Thiotrichaceae bacterium]